MCSLNWSLFGASSNFDFIDITIFCHGIYYKSPSKFLNYLFFCFLNTNDWQVMISCTFLEVVKVYASQYAKVAINALVSKYLLLKLESDFVETSMLTFHWVEIWKISDQNCKEIHENITAVTSLWTCTLATTDNLLV